MHTSHYMLHTSHWMLHNSHQTLDTSHCLLHTSLYPIHTAHFTLHAANFTLHTRQIENVENLNFVVREESYPSDKYSNCKYSKTFCWHLTGFIQYQNLHQWRVLLLLLFPFRTPELSKLVIPLPHSSFVHVGKSLNTVILALMITPGLNNFENLLPNVCFT